MVVRTTETRHMFGRQTIYTDQEQITHDNVVEVLLRAAKVHAQNQNEIQYLWDYYRGKTPILAKKKLVRESINHKVNINRAYEIVTFKRGYGFGEPIQYVRRGSDESLTDDIEALNGYMFAENKHTEDSALAEWIYVAGLGMRMALPGDGEDEPFRIYTLDPRYSFVVKYNGLGEKVLMGVKFIMRESKWPVYSVYTKDWYYEIESGIITKSYPHALGDVPIFEYPANAAKTGAFEVVLSLLDAISELESNRMDDLVQSVNSFLALLGGTIDDETAAKLDEYKMLCLPDGVDAKYLSVPMQQSDLQVLANNLYDTVLTICGIPNRNGGSSTSDTGSAVYLRDGFGAAETQMQIVENEFKRSETRFLRMVLRIMRDMVGTRLTARDVEIKFSRRNYDNIQTKSQVLVSMLNNGKIHPELAFLSSGLFLDPESAYLQSKEWWEENERKEAEEMENYVKSLGDSDEKSVQPDRQDNSLSE